MSQGPQNLKGTPNTDIEDTVRLLLYCGGSGGGDCPVPLGAPGIVIPLRVPKYITFNRKIVIRNDINFGFRVYNDNGPDVFCSHSFGGEVPVFMALAADDSLDIETVATAGIEFTNSLGVEFEFPADMCPQPTDPAWENIVYVYVWWGGSGYVNYSGFSVAAILAGGFPPLSIVKHDKDTRQ